MDFDNLLNLAVGQGASDVHFQAGAGPMMRVAGEIRPLAEASLTNEEVGGFVSRIAPRTAHAHLEDAIVEGLDFSHWVPGLARFRCSVYSHLGQVGLVMRVVRTRVPKISELNVPSILRDVALSGRGFTLVTGTAGSGRSTTLAAMAGLINDQRQIKIVTVEDPIEYIHTNRRALVSQLEVGIDTPAFARALQQALRQDPDVILISELRDIDSVRLALRAADAGHQVLSTVQSADVVQAIDRVAAMFPPAEYRLLLSQFARQLEAVVAQRLLSTLDGDVRPAVEVLRGNAIVEKLIVENRLHELMDYVRGGESGMQTFDQHLLRLYNEHVISGTEALRAATRPESLALAMRHVASLAEEQDA